MKLFREDNRGTLKGDFYQISMDEYHLDAIQGAMPFSTGEIQLTQPVIYNQLLNRNEFIIGSQLETVPMYRSNVQVDCTSKMSGHNIRFKC